MTIDNGNQEGIVIKQRNKLLTNKMPMDWHKTKH